MRILDKAATQRSIWGRRFPPGLYTHRRQASFSRSMSSSGRAAASLPDNTERMDGQLERTITAIHGTRSKAVLFVTGGGSQALAWLLAVPGASNTVLEATVPYAQHSLTDLLGQEPVQYCSEDTAVQMAVAAYRRAATVSSFASGPLLGVAATCGLATVAVKRGEHRAFLAVHDASGTSTLSLHLAKGLRSRSQEESLVSQALIKMLAEASGLEASALQLPLISAPSHPPPLHLIPTCTTMSAGNLITGVDSSSAANETYLSNSGNGGGSCTPAAMAGAAQYDAAPGSSSAGDSGLSIGAGPPGSARPSWQGESQRASPNIRPASSSRGPAGEASATTTAGPSAASDRLPLRGTSRGQLPSIPDHQQLPDFPGLSLASSVHPVDSSATSTLESATDAPAVRDNASNGGGAGTGSSSGPSGRAATATRSNNTDMAASDVVWREGVTHDGWRLNHVLLGDPLQALLAGKVRCVEYAHGQVVVDAPRGRRLYLPGSFNPLHVGHKQLLAAAQSVCGPGWEAGYELTVSNADKGMLAYEDVAKRVQQFTATGLPLLLTNAPLYTIKAEMLPHCKFVIGYDTAVRILQPKYYGNSETQMYLDFARLHHQHCSFIVAGRVDSASSRFLTMDDVEVPQPMQPWNLFQGLSEQQFRADISSTQLRAAAAAAAAAQQQTHS